jgi:hypothetical protein
MTMRQLIYSSQPFGYDAAMLGGILIGARRNNRRDGLTGALICRHDIYLQLLEGPADAVVATFARIRRDDRHNDIAQICSTEVDARMFPDWDMLDDPARSWLWPPAEVARGAVGAAGANAVVAVFQRIAAELRGNVDAATEI